MHGKYIVALRRSELRAARRFQLFLGSSAVKRLAAQRNR
jgi:hypothetical protein